jgi:beta-lactamase superfamily II metal-dependent hydrolase
MNGKLSATFWDVQHGSAAWLEMPNGDHIVFDLGSGSLLGPDAFSPLRWLRERRGVRQLAATIISHPHRDHVDDIENLDLVRPRALLRPRLTEAEVRGDNRQQDAPKIDAYLRFDRDYSGSFGPGESPLTGRSDGAHFESFLPTRCPADNLNNRSVVSVVSYADGKLLLCGDNEPPSWLELLAQQRFRQAIVGTDVLLASHHGRDSGFCPELFDVIRPRLTIISDGRFCDSSATTRYKAVTSGWTTNYRRGGSERRFCLTTRRDGDITIALGRNSDGGRYVQALAGQYA